MKVKTVGTGCNRKQLKTKCLELAALVEWNGVQLEVIDVVNKKLSKEIIGLESKFKLQGELLSEIKDKLIEQKNIICRATRANEEMVRDFYEQSKDINRLKDVVVAANAELDRRDTIISNQNSTISDLQLKVINLSSEMERLKKPIWKKVKECLVK